MDSKQKGGVIQISDEVIAVIAATAAKEVDGVTGLVSLAGGNLMNRFSKKTSNREKGVSLLIENGEVSVDMAIMTKFNCKIRELAQAVQENVKNTIETMTGLKVINVNVKVADVDFQQENKKEVEE